MDSYDLPVAPINLAGAWYVPLEAVMKALGHAVEIKAPVVKITRGGSPKTRLPTIQPYQRPK
jgi:hypothetical protein